MGDVLPPARIGIDIAGSDCAQSDILDGVLSFNPVQFENIPFCLSIYMKEDEREKEKIQDLLQKKGMQYSASLIVTESAIEMDEDPFHAVLSKKKTSTLMKAFTDLSNGSIDAVISTANTGALVLGATAVVGRLQGVQRPPLAVEIPSLHRTTNCVVLDVGASVHIDEKDILSYAFLGTVYWSSLYQEEEKKPTLAILNIGVEPLKGMSVLKKIYSVLEKNQKALPFTFIGNVEPKDIFSKNAPDIVVTGGFAGNIFLKTGEAVLEAVHINPDELLGKEKKKILRKSAILLGMNKLIFKCHGRGTPTLLQTALYQAVTAVTHENLGNRISSSYSRYADVLSAVVEDL